MQQQKWGTDGAQAGAQPVRPSVEFHVDGEQEINALAHRVAVLSCQLDHRTKERDQARRIAVIWMAAAGLAWLSFILRVVT